MKTVASSTFRSNGCGYMLACADVLTAIISGSELTELHGLDTSELFANVEQELGPIPADRRECLVACTDAIRTAFADHRSREIEEFRGEKALICTCFGVAEQTIEHLIDSGRAIAVDDVKAACRAGSGCGSCTMLIEEMLNAGQTR